MKRLLYSGLFGTILLLLLSAQGLRATHVMGTDITYECTGSCTYRVYLKVYYDCTGGAMGLNNIPVSTGIAPGASDPELVPEGGCPTPIPTNEFVQSYQEVTPICPALLNPPPGVAYPTGCENTSNPSINGVAEAIYIYDYDLCNFACDSVTLIYDDCCRNGSITSIDGPTGAAIYTGTAGINLTNNACNNSPVFQDAITGNSLPPIAYICAGESSTFNQGAFDPDGDSLAYRLASCFDGPGVPVTYLPGYGPQQPMGPTWDVQIDPITGDLTFAPSPTGAVEVGVICIIVEEWRNGELIGEITRDMQVTVLNNCSSSPPLTSGITNLTLGPDQVPATPLSYNEVRTCAGTEVCFELPTLVQDPSLVYTMQWNQGIPGGTFVDANNPAVADTITGTGPGVAPVARFCWTPPVGARGSYFFRVTIRDDACPIPGINQFTIIIYVEDGLANTQIVTDTVGCNDIELAYLLDPIVPGQFSNVITQIEWTGNGNLQYNPNTNDSSFIHTYPAPGNYFVNLVLTDTFGCRSRIPGAVNVPTGAIADAGPDVTLCANDQFQLGTPAIAGQTYQWTPNVNLDDDTLAQPTFILPPGPIVQDSFFYTVTVSDGTCTTFDYTEVLINPALEIDVTPTNPIICPGDSVTLRVTGNLQADYEFLWSTGDTLDSIRVAPNETQVYSVLAFSDGCSSAPVEATVTVQEGPQATISGDPEVCPDGLVTLDAAGGDSYLWSAGNFTGDQITLGSITGDSTIYLTAFSSAGCAGPQDSITLTLLPEPIAGFTADLVCEGGRTQFIDTSSVPGGNIIRWSWDFGDGTQTQGESPRHTFTQPGSYDVTLEVTSDRGCRSTTVQPIVVSAAPTTDFTIEEVCEGSASPFVSTSTIEPGNEITSWAWDFGDGNTGNGESTSHVYDSFGNYNVTLRTSTPEGCVDSFTRTVFVNPLPEPDFTFDQVCEGREVQFINQSTVAGDRDFVAGSNWDFGQAPGSPINVSTDINPRRRYDSTGVYAVTLAVTTNNGCSADTTIEMEVYERPTADFTYDQTCENEQTVFTQTAVSNPATPLESFQWDLGDSSTVAEGPTARIRYGIGNYGTYNVRLIAETSVGCADTVTRAVVINPSPTPAFYADAVCLLDSTVFIDTSSLALGRIVERQWDFDDGRVSFGLNPLHEYRTDGTYSVSLTLTSDSGCVRSATRPVVVHPLPELLQMREDSVCFGEPAAIYAVSTQEVQVNWYYNENDSLPFHVGNALLTDPLPVTTTYYVEPESRFGCINDRSPITARVYEGADLELVISDEVVEIPGAIVEFRVASTLPLTEYQWSFGDRSPFVTGPNPVHEYQYPGKYEVRVNTTDLYGCEASIEGLVEVKRQVDIFTPTAFTPNQDGNNDRYRVQAVNVRDFNIQIFNRWGQMVFESDDPGFEWDGISVTSQRPVNEGVYVVVVRALDLDGNDIEETRTVTVFR